MRRAVDQLFNQPVALPATEYILELVGGRSADAVRQTAHARNADAILVGAPKAGGLRAMLRAQARRNLLSAGVPVVVVPETRASGDSLMLSDREAQSANPEVETWWW